ncbi:GntR family transcriptional regulator [Seohaeicola saemankumensis]|uniref:GntR family transcriptional regulator n=1 Tax=Seohaeicola saemankumensis TaxID=481181 RepID=UPI0035D04674
MTTLTKADDQGLGLLRDYLSKELAVAGATKRSALRTAIVYAINSGAFVAGQRLPPETALAEALGVSVGTVQAALGQVQDLGLIERRRGDGTRVRQADGEFGPGIWHFRMYNLSTGEPARIINQEIEITANDTSGPWCDHLGDGRDYTAIRRSIDLTGGVRIGAEMMLDANLISARAITPSSLRLANLRTVLEQKLQISTMRVSHMVRRERLSPRASALYRLNFDIDILRVEARTYLADNRPFYFQTIYAPADQVALEF